MQKQIVLLGAGHAHVEVVRRYGLLDAAARRNTAITMITESTRTGYSGMMPGVIAGHYSRDQAEIDVAALCTRCNVRLVAAPISAIEASANRVRANGETFPFDALSVNTGSQPAPPEGAHGLHLTVKPFGQFLDSLDALVACKRIVVVGGGAASVEVLLALAYRARVAKQNAQFQLLTGASRLLPGYPENVARHAERAFRTFGADFRTGVTVTACTPDGLRLENGEQIACDGSVWATRAGPNAATTHSDLLRSADGFIAVDQMQRSVSHRNVFAVGDCATRVDSPLPKSGLVPVRQGQWLLEQLLDAAHGQTSSEPFTFQKNALALLALGEKRATGVRGARQFSGRWVWYWKDYIDRRFMQKYA